MKIILLTLFLLPLATFAESIIRPKGTYEYIEKIVIKKMRIAETVSHVSDVGRDRIKFLKDEGFLCVRKNQTKLLY